MIQIVGIWGGLQIEIYLYPPVIWRVISLSLLYNELVNWTKSYQIISFAVVVIIISCVYLTRLFHYCLCFICVCLTLSISRCLSVFWGNNRTFCIHSICFACAYFFNVTYFFQPNMYVCSKHRETQENYQNF